MLKMVTFFRGSLHELSEAERIPRGYYAENVSHGNHQDCPGEGTRSGANSG